MINFQKRYTKLATKRTQHKNRNKLAWLYYSAQREICRALIHAFVPTYLKSTANKYRLAPTNSIDNKSPRIIVSLCSFPARLNTLWIVVELLMRQTVKPDMIILHLSKQQVPSMDAIPQSLLNMQERGLQIQIEDGEDLKPYGKIYFAKKKYPKDIIITVDDDIYYTYDIIERLIESHRKHPNCVIANRARAITYDETGELMSYNSWETVKANEGTSSLTLLQTGVGGVLYPPSSLHKDFFDKDLFMRLAPMGDDLWLFAMTKLNNNRVVRSNFEGALLDIKIKGNTRLLSSNVHHNQNDIKVENIRNYYKDKLSTDLFAKG